MLPKSGEQRSCERPALPPTTLYRRLRKWGFSATNRLSGPVAPCSSPLSGGALVGRFGCGMPLNAAVLCPENRHGSLTTSPHGLQSLLTTNPSDAVYSHDHYQRSQHNLLHEVQNEDRNHQRGAGHPKLTPLLDRLTIGAVEIGAITSRYGSSKSPTVRMQEPYAYGRAVVVTTF